MTRMPINAALVLAVVITASAAGCSQPASPPAQEAASPAAGAAAATKTGLPPSADTGHTDAGVDAAIDQLHGNHQAFREVFDRLQNGLAANDKAAVAALMVYPLEVEIDGTRSTIMSDDALIEAWDRVMTPAITQVIAKQQYRDLFVNGKGVMLGNGEVWLNASCFDNACTKSGVGVTTLQSAPR